MTREEAIAILNKCQQELEFKTTSSNFYALAIAIVALENWEPVVRCKDCDRSKEIIQYKVLEGIVDGLVCGNTGSFTSPDGYCSNGRRREECG